MKRIFKNIALCLTIAGAGLTAVSCDSETINQILNEVLGNLVNTGQTYVYSGVANIQCLEGPNASQLAEIAKGTAQLQVSLKSSTTGTITIQGFTMKDIKGTGTVTMSSVTLNNLAMSTDNNQTQTLIIGDNSSFGQNDKLTYNNTDHPATNLFIESATATSEAISLKMTIWFGDQTDAVNLEYSGNAVTQ
jgi:hypothetical protein